MEALVKSLLSLSRLEQQARPAHLPVDLSSAMVGVALAFESAAYEAGKTVDMRVEDGIWCLGDVEKLKQAMLPLGAPAPSDPNAQYRTRCFLEFTVRGVDVDVMAGFVILENGQEHDCALKPEQVAEHILVRGEDIPLQSLEDWRRYYAWMGRTSKVAMIDGKTMR